MYFYSGNVEGSRRELNAARGLCNGRSDDAERARIELTQLGLFLGVDPLETAHRSCRN